MSKDIRKYVYNIVNFTYFISAIYFVHVILT